ncbi:MAG: cyclopropane-fatty-acyl-phospholipid synthase family protein, partial [Acidobacteriota bacterium]
MYQRLIHKVLAKLRVGHIHLVLQGERRDYGDPNSHLEATLEVHDPSFFRDIARRGEVGLGQSFVAGKWSSGDLDDLMLIFQLNFEAFLPMMRGGTVLLQGFRWMERWTQKLILRDRRSTLEGSRHGMSKSYDVGNDFFRLGLGPSMQYSCAIWPFPGSTLDAAQEHKLDLLIRKLDPRPGHKVLDIGCGWGTLLGAIHERHGCEVKGISLAGEQINYCREHHPQGTFEHQDYRELPPTETFDRIVSVGMIEHVGYGYLQTFMDAVARHLKPGGRAVLHTMVVGDLLDLPPGVHFDAFVFTVMPVGYVPLPRELLQAVRRSGDLHLVHTERFGPHYGQTFCAWRRNLHANRPEVVD